MNNLPFEAWLMLALQLLKEFRAIDWNATISTEVSRELRAAKTLEEAHAAVNKLRDKVTKKP